MRPRRIVVVAAFVAALFMPAVQPVHATDRAGQWRALAEQAIARFVAVDDGRQQAFAYASMAGALGRLYGWDDPRVTTYLTKLYSLANPDGGWGIGFRYDQNGDGSINPADTTYTVTLGGHVGPVLLEGYRAGVVPAAKVRTVVSLLMSTPRIDNAQGQCLSYSRSPNDDMAPHCVHNVNAGAGAFLADALAAGIVLAGQARLILEITRREVYSYLPDTMWWHYRDTPSLNDADHGSYEAESMYRLAPWIGREAAWNHMTRELNDGAASPIAHLRLTSLPPAPGSPDWCALGDRWLPDMPALLTSPAPVVGGYAGTRPAQVAYLAARNADACA